MREIQIQPASDPSSHLHLYLGTATGRFGWFYVEQFGMERTNSFVKSEEV